MVAGKGSGAKGQQPEALNTFHACGPVGKRETEGSGSYRKGRHCPEGEGSLEEE